MGAVLVSALTLGGCATSIAQLPIVGTPADAPAPPSEPGTYLPVHDMPPDRDEPVIPAAERAKIEKELIAARDRQASVVKAQGSNAQGSNGQGSSKQASSNELSSNQSALAK